MSLTQISVSDSKKKEYFLALEENNVIYMNLQTLHLQFENAIGIEALIDNEWVP